jgi:hypothetical protein
VKGYRLFLKNVSLDFRANDQKYGIYDIDVKNQHGLIVTLFRGHSRSIRGEFLTTGGDNE